MKKLFLFASSILLMMSCTEVRKGSPEEAAELINVEFNPHSFLVTDSLLPREIDLNMDISDMTLMELRLLRHYPYALKGVWFMEDDINTFYSRKTKWYLDRCFDYLEKHDYDALIDFNKAGISKEEKGFIMRIDARIKELKELQITDVDGLKLANPAMTVNMFQMEEVDKPFLSHLAHHNFAVIPTKNEQLFNIYEQNEYDMMPSYITTDVFLQAYHMYFSYVLKSLEKHCFVPRMSALNTAMYKKAMEIASSSTPFLRRYWTYFSKYAA